MCAFGTDLYSGMTHRSFPTNSIENVRRERAYVPFPAFIISYLFFFSLFFNEQRKHFFRTFY